MAEVALGWLGWTEQQALETDVNAILVAHEGRLSMFETIGWIERIKQPEKTVKPAEGHQLTAELFDAVFG